MLKIGEHVQRWRVRRYIGHGATSSVYEAEDEHGVVVALKLLHAEHCQSTDLIVRFMNEALPIRGLCHPGLPRIHAVEIPVDSAPFIIMEMLGESMDTRLRQGDLTRAEAIAAVAQLAAALAAVHACGIVHRDVKPANILMAGAGRVKLIDFGLAKVPSRGAAGLSAFPVSTAAGDRCGTPDYRAPEQWRDAKAVDDRADIYSLGIVLYELLTGRLPFQTESAGRLRLLHTMSRPPLLEAPPPLPALYARMLAKDPHDRPSAGEIAATLERLSGS